MPWAENTAHQADNSPRNVGCSRFGADPGVRIAPVSGLALACSHRRYGMSLFDTGESPRPDNTGLRRFLVAYMTYSIRYLNTHI